MALTKTSFSMIQDGSVNIRDFGAACDWNGSSGTDDTAAIQAAIDYAILNKKAVFFPGMSKITASIIVPGDTRGLHIYGVDARNTGIHNANTSSADALIIGNNVDACYDIVIRDFRIEGNGSYTDGKGLAAYFVLYSNFQNVFVEFVGSHGFWFENVGQTTIFGTHARRCGYGSGSTSIAGLSLKGNSSYAIKNHMSEECAVGIWADAASVNLNNVYVNDNQNGGIRLTNGCNFTAFNCYSEYTAAGNNNWYIGDGVTPTQYAFIRDSSCGNTTGLYFNKVQYYLIDGFDFGGYDATENVFIVDPAFTKGTVKAIYPRNTSQTVTDKSTIIQHSPSQSIKLTSQNNLLGDNGSFEQDLTTNWTKNWYGSSGTVSYTDVAGLGYDVGDHALQIVASSTPSTLYIRPTAPTTVAGKFYTLEFDYFSNNKLFVTCTTGGVRHFNLLLPVTSAEGMHYRIIFKANGTIGTLEFQVQDTGTYKIDGVTLYDGLYGQT